MTIYQGDVLERLRELPGESVQCCVTSPPYWGLRDYGMDKQLGLEPTLEEFVTNMVAVFVEVRRVLREDGTCWVNMGDAYASGGQCGGSLKPKDMMGMPWRVAFALQADGWYLRSDIIWAKPNSMPESVSDRPTKGHEYIFLMTKSPKYYYDADAIKTNSNTSLSGKKWPGIGPQHGSERDRGEKYEPMATHQKSNRRTVWNIPTQSYPEAHFATFPEMIPKLCILAGTSGKGCCSKCGAPWVRGKIATGHVNKREPAHVPGNADTKTDSTGWAPTSIASDDWSASCECDAEIVPCVVLDPFLGSGTTGLVAQNEGREWIGIELNPEYAALAEKRTRNPQQSLGLV